jgi:hypothetical protein
MTNITAESINLLFERMNLILGNGSGQNGYGQGQGIEYGPEISTYPVSNNPSGNLPTIISAADINALFADMLRCRIHQIGTAPTEIAEIVQNLNVIGLNSSFFINDQGIVTTDPDGNKKGIVDYQNLMTQIEADKFLAHPSQMSLENGITAVRTTAWNGIITHEFTVSFLNADHRRHFFNSGGEIRFTSNNSNSNTSKGQDWNSMLVGIATVIFDYRRTLSTASAGTGSNIGNYQLTNNYQLLYRKVRSTGAIVYSGNEYTIEGRQSSTSQLQFRVRYADISDSLNNRNVDENVTGRLESNIRIFRASSDVSVKVPAPNFTNNISLS